ncbi:MAG: tetratricopeptide repeat protein [Verrucomicrobia bacterium]|nr:MAG: tetratricopeptide repeat protein [Verrucomicrobiota bacterium]
MQINPIVSISLKYRALWIGVIIALCNSTPLLAGEKNAPTASNQASMAEAHMLLTKGDEAYQAQRYQDAVTAYQGAREMLSNSSGENALLAASSERLAIASTELARDKSRQGDVAGAKAILDALLNDKMVPENHAAKVLRQQLDDPIRTNPALTPQHAKDVDSVRRLLYMAEGSFNLGKYDEAKANFEEALRIDPYNSAARRGLEKVASFKTGYYKAASDQSRSEILGQVDQAWELEVPRPDTMPDLGEVGEMSADINSRTVGAKLEQIIIDRIALEQASLEESLDFLRMRSMELDTSELDVARKGVNFMINLGDENSEQSRKVRAMRFDLRLTQVPLAQVLRYITDMTGTKYDTDDFAVLITPVGGGAEDLVSRTYRVPPDFITNLSGSATTANTQQNVDPFNTTQKSSSLLPARKTAQEAFAAQGVSFPEGASANFSPATSLLRVVNTPLNQEYIAQIIDAVSQTEPVVVTVKVTMLKVEQTDLEELGFDWILDNFSFGDPGWVPGTNTLNLTGGTTGNGGDLSDIPLPPGEVTRNPITAGNRSGDEAISNSAIDEVIGQRSGRQSSARAPGILGVRGLINEGSLQMLMRGLDQKKGTDLLISPAVTTRSGQISSIKVAREFIYPTEYEPPELPNETTSTSFVILQDGVPIAGGNTGSSPAVTPATPTAFATREVGVVLEVLPVVDASKQFVDLTLNPSVSDFDGFVNYGSPITTTRQSPTGPVRVALTENAILMPVFSTNRLNTNLRVQSGATIVIGGLLSEKVQLVEDKTPILGDIPIAGRLFQSKASRPVKTAIVFFVNVAISDPTGRSFSAR